MLYTSVRGVTPSDDIRPPHSRASGGDSEPCDANPGTAREAAWLPAPGQEARPRVGVSRVVLTLGLVSLLTDASSEMVAAVLPLYLTATVGLSPFAYGAVDGLYQGGSSLVRIVGGLSSDLTRRPKWIALIGYGLSAVCKLALLPSTALLSIGAVIGVDRIGKGLRTAPRDTMIAQHSAPEVMGRSFGVHRALDTLGAAAGPLIAFALLRELPNAFSSLFVVSFCLALVGLAVLALMVPDLRPVAGGGACTPSRPGWAQARRAGSVLIRGRSFRRLCMGTLLVSATTVTDGFVYLRLQQSTDLPAAWFPLLYLGSSLVYLALAVPLGRLADRAGRVRVFAAGNVVAVGCYALLIPGHGGPGLTVAVLALLGTYYAATDGVLAAVTTALAPVPVRGTALAIVQTVVAVGRMLAAVTFGAVWAWVGAGPALAGFAVALAAAGTGLVCLVRDPA